MSHRFAIKVPDGSLKIWGRLLPLLEEVLPLKFSEASEVEAGTAGEILASNVIVAEQRHRERLSSFSLPDLKSTSRVNGLTKVRVEFSETTEVPFPFRARVIQAELPADLGALSLSRNEQALATSSRGPIWTLSKEAGINHFRSALPLPILPPEGNLADVLNQARFLEMLPFVHWLRLICAPESYDGPSPKACFIFDDPNLHWPTYGFVDYHRIALQARKENYHVSFATIPLDGWFVHKQTVQIFQQNRSWLSLSVHGNNHTKGELGKVYSDSQRSFLLQEAIQRIRTVERQTGLSIARVMIPPHGACSEKMLSALPECGFEAACISHGSLRHHNRSSAWTNALGFRPSELIFGCPVLPRWGLAGNLQNTILLAAYLKQAIILRGHHQDLRDRPELLDETARFVNGLGSVEWVDLTDLVRSNYQWRNQGDLWRVKPLSRKLVCSAPIGFRRFQIDPTDNLPKAWRIVGLNGSIAKPSVAEVVDLEDSRSFTLEIPSLPAIETKITGSSRVSLWFIRRLLTEGRDRLQSTWRRGGGRPG
jgi:hypothetical protein